MQKKIIHLGLLICYFYVMFFFMAGKDAYSDPNQTQIDAQLRGMWSEMCRALANRDIEKAATFFAIETRANYRAMFIGLRDQLPELVKEMQEIELVQIKGNTAVYRARKAELYGGKIVNMTYHVYFGHDFDGSWKIYRY